MVPKDTMTANKASQIPNPSVILDAVEITGVLAVVPDVGPLGKEDDKDFVAVVTFEVDAVVIEFGIELLVTSLV